MLLILIAFVALTSALAPLKNAEKLPAPVSRIPLQKIPNSPSRLLRGSLFRQSLEQKHSRAPGQTEISNFAGEQGEVAFFSLPFSDLSPPLPYRCAVLRTGGHWYSAADLYDCVRHWLFQPVGAEHALLHFLAWLRLP